MANGHGGYREGAGRKGVPEYAKRKNLSLTLSPHGFGILKELSKDLDMSYGGLFDILLEKEKKRLMRKGI